ncbi:MAG: serine hydrolase domain-containing protein [Dehalococcoidia bacterium]
MTPSRSRPLTSAGSRALSAVAREHLDRGWHHGAQLAVYRDGVLRLDERLGAAAPAEARMLWFSATKPLTAVCILMLAERGQLDLDRPIADVWPEFGEGGKAACTPRHVLTHRGGFPIFPRDFDWASIGDWDAVTRAVAGLAAQWESGAEVGYHPVTYGFVLGELIRRVDGRMPREFMRDELFGPIGMEASLGVDQHDLSCVVPVEAMSEVTFEDPEGVERRTSEMVERFNRPSTLMAQIPAANAVGTAEALARFYAMLEQGGSLGETTVLRPETVADATRVQAESVADRTTGLPSSYGLGFMVGGIWEPYAASGVFGHGGQQCAIGYADPSSGLALAYITNGLQDPATYMRRIEDVVAAARAASE